MGRDRDGQPMDKSRRSVNYFFKSISICQMSIWPLNGRKPDAESQLNGVLIGFHLAALIGIVLCERFNANISITQCSKKFIFCHVNSAPPPARNT